MRDNDHKLPDLHKKTIFHSRLRKWGMVFLFVITLPYIISVFWPGDRSPDDHAQDAVNRDSRITVRVKGPTGTSFMTMEEYLYGCLPTVIPVEYELECLKAQAILLRTWLIATYKGELTMGRNLLEEPADTWLSRQQLEEIWGSSFQEKYDKVIQAVSETKGIYMTYQGNPIEACYFRVSAGRTRSGTEILGREIPYLQSVECPKDYLSDDYLTQTVIKKKELEKLLGGSLIAVEADMAGYAKSVTLRLTDAQRKEQSIQKRNSQGGSGHEPGQAGEFVSDNDIYDGNILNGNVYKEALRQQTRSGEWIREKLLLNSSNFTMEEDGKEIRFAVKGVGHGLGMSQFGANELAKEGKDCNTILTFFFQNITMDKYE